MLRNLRLTPCGGRPLSPAPPWKRRLCAFQENNNRTLSRLWGLLYGPFGLKIACRSGLCFQESRNLVSTDSTTLRVCMETNEEKEYTRARSNVSPKLLLDGKTESRCKSFLHLRVYHTITAAFPPNIRRRYLQGNSPVTEPVKLHDFHWRPTRPLNFTVNKTHPCCPPFDGLLSSFLVFVLATGKNAFPYVFHSLLGRLHTTGFFASFGFVDDKYWSCSSLAKCYHWGSDV